MVDAMRRGTDPNAEEARTAFTSYVDAVDAYWAEQRRATDRDPSLRRLGKRLVPHKRRVALRMWGTRALAPRELRRAHALAHARPVRLHFGSAANRKPGWVNVDLLGDPVDLAWDVTTPLPFETESVDAVFHEHLLEHLELRSGLAFLEECRRILRPHALIRIGVPDGERYARAYVDGDRAFLERGVRLGVPRPTDMLALEEIFYYEGHRTMYDFETLRLALRAAGFRAPERRGFGETALDACPDSEHRERDTLYVEAKA